MCSAQSVFTSTSCLGLIKRRPTRAGHSVTCVSSHDHELLATVCTSKRFREFKRSRQAHLCEHPGRRQMCGNPAMNMNPMCVLTRCRAASLFMPSLEPYEALPLRRATRQKESSSPVSGGFLNQNNLRLTVQCSFSRLLVERRR